MRQLKSDAAATFYGLDNQGHCLIAESTLRSILLLWQEIVAQHQLQAEVPAAPLAEPRTPPPESDGVPAQSYRIPGYSVTMPAGQ